MSSAKRHGRRAQHVRATRRVRDQRLDVQSQGLVAATGLTQERRPLVRLALERLPQKTVDERPPFVVHDVVLACPGVSCRRGPG